MTVSHSKVDLALSLKKALLGSAGLLGLSRTQLAAALGDEALYVASSSPAGPADPSAQLLYVGSADGDRMFRGDSDLKAGENFHHANIHGGPKNDRLARWLTERGPLYLHSVDGAGLVRLAPAGSRWAQLVQHPRRTSRNHFGFWLKQAILLESRALPLKRSRRRAVGGSSVARTWQ